MGYYKERLFGEFERRLNEVEGRTGRQVSASEYDRIANEVYGGDVDGFVRDRGPIDDGLAGDNALEEGA